MSAAQGEEFLIDEGMEIVTEEGEAVGRVAAILVDEETGEGAFIILGPATGGEERLLPIEVIADSENGKLVAEMFVGDIENLPLMPQDRDPTDEEIEQAYDAVGLVADEDEE